MVPTSLSSEFTAVVNPAMAGQVAIGRHAMSSSFTGSLPSISETEENDYLTDCQAVHSFFGRIGRQLEISALTRFALLFSSDVHTPTRITTSSSPDHNSRYSYVHTLAH